MYEDFLHKIYANHPDHIFSSSATETDNPADLIPTIPDQGMAFVEYLIGPIESFVFVVRPSANKESLPIITVRKLDIDRSDLGDLVNEFRNAIAKHLAVDRFSETGNKLYNLLIAPIATDLQGVSTLGIIPDAILWDLPFAALRSPKLKYLVEDYSLFYAPSTTSLKAIMKPVNPSVGQQPLLAMAPFANHGIGDSTRDGYAPLPRSGEEIDLICMMVHGAHCYSPQAGSETEVKTSGKNYHILHFATHGVYDAANPMYSSILLAPGDRDDGFWTGREIAESQLNAVLIVLSACETARGQIRFGEGPLGLSWAFFAAGSRSNLLALWEIDDQGTKELMKNFYGGLQPAVSENKWDSLQRSQALRKAQLKLISEQNWSHPYFWAGFGLIGDWR